MFDKEEQRRRAAAFTAEQIAKGVKPVVSQPLPPVKQVNPGWPFGTINNPTPPQVQPAPSWPLPPVKSKTLDKKVPRVKKLNYDACAQVNHLGQTLMPGMPVIAVTTGYSHRVTVRKGKYLGVRFDSRGKAKAYVIEAEFEGYTWVIKGTDTRCAYNHPSAEYKKTKTIRRSTLPGMRVYPTL